jgi:predicted transposase YdaD
VLKLFRFMDYVLTLTEELSVRFDADLAQLEENLHMPYVTSIERHALQRGREEGREEGRQEGRQEGMVQGAADLLLQALEVRFGDVPTALLEKIRQCQDVAVLRTLLKQALTAGSLEELQF